MVLTFGSSATEIHEPCQVRNEAALSESFCVPEGCLDRANCTGNVCGLLFEAERAVFYVIGRAYEPSYYIKSTPCIMHGMYKENQFILYTFYGILYRVPILF